MKKDGDVSVGWVTVPVGCFTVHQKRTGTDLKNQGRAI